MAISKNDFFPEILFSKYTDAELRKEYSRLRSIARKRLERMSTSEYSESQTYLKHKNLFVPVAQIRGKKQLAELLTSVEEFVSSRKSSIRGLNAIRRQSIETLHRHGYDFVTKENYKIFTDFMQDFSDKFARSYGSPTGDELKAFIEGRSKRRVSPEELKAALDKYMEDMQ